MTRAQRSARSQCQNGNNVPKPLLRSLSLAGFIKSSQTKFISNFCGHGQHVESNGFYHHDRSTTLCSNHYNYVLLLNKGATPKAITFRKLFPKQLREGDERIHTREKNVCITIVLCHCKRIRSLKICIEQKFTKKYAEKKHWSKFLKFLKSLVWDWMTKISPF